jgi:Squalene-hopene cyclase C-terminal domain
LLRNRHTLVMAFVLFAWGASAEAQTSTAEERALAFLQREVPRWSRKNHCFSCHNNGDGARALYAGLRAGFAIAPTATQDTTAWLSDPERWEHNGGDGPFSDKRLARLQFTTALAAARRAGAVRDQRPLLRAAAGLAQDQAEDGSWPIEGENEPGSPVVYGRLLATFLARESLRAADPAAFRKPIDRGGRWLLGQQIKTVTDASVMLMVTAAVPSPRSPDIRKRCIALLRRAQADSGGWGPFVKSPPEVYDTALALIGLNGIREAPPVRTLIARGRAYLIGEQQADGSWIETTRPPGAESYAQRISTCGWATMALLETRSMSLPGADDPKP